MTTSVTENVLLDRLNSAQREAVLHGEGPLLVLAGAGSGKTRVLTSRIAWLVEQHGVAPAHILSVTFTNKAASEMRERVAALLGERPASMWSGTFHSIGARMLRREARLVGRTSNFTIYDEDDSLGAIKRIMDRLRISAKEWSPKTIRGAISEAKNALVRASEYEALARDPVSRAAAAVYRELEGTLRESNAVDFDDLLVLPVRVLQENPDRLGSYRNQFRHILVDEYQDTNRAQYEFVRLLGGAHGNVCVVGDDDQSIYGWRGADIRNILDFEKDFPKAVVVRLEENYRSAPQILDVANAVIGANQGRRGKTLRATQAPGERATLVACLDERDEARFVADELLLRRRADRDLGLRDIAVLYRTNAQSRALEDAMRRHDIPYRLIGAVRFYDRREIRDLTSYLKLIANPSDDEAFLRAVGVPRRGLGDTTLEALSARAREAGVSLLVAAERIDLQQGLRGAAHQPLADFARLIRRYREQAAEASVDALLRDLIEEIRFADYLRGEGTDANDRMDNVKELIAGAAETVSDEGGEVGLTPLDHFLQRASLLAGADALDPNADAVVMMTMHNAKGLEFPVVFVTGLEDGLFPLAKAHDDPALLEEERRLFYVGITRAERKLYLTHAEQRRRNGEMLRSKASKFLKDIPRNLLDERPTIALRSSGRASFMAGRQDGGFNRQRGEGVEREFITYRPSLERPGVPVRLGSSFDDAAEVSQDAPEIAVGCRVKHAKFGTGIIAELHGVGRDTKVRIDFDDVEIGRKTLVVAQAKLERGYE
ncbi:MAG: UvrD-helicase domain-containing protein [Anaerolineae bacterium]|nr:UvrD-helicase domain-containing protein [Gemmatimonadaceae bacterium]